MSFKEISSEGGGGAVLNRGFAVLTYLFRVLHRFCLVLTPKGWNFASAQTGWIYISYFGHPASRNVCKIKVLRSGVALNVQQLDN